MVDVSGGTVYMSPPDDRPAIWCKGRQMWRGLLSVFARGRGRPTGAEEGPTTTLRTGAASATGNYRVENEDRCYNDCRCGVLLIADGIGGHPGGALASRILIDTVPPVLSEALAEDEMDVPRMTELVRGAMEEARQAMICCAQRRPKFNRMGATMALAVIADNVLYAARVGDCRVYHLREGRLRRLAEDETYVQVLVEAGTINRQQARSHPYRHHVLNWVGVEPLHCPVEVTATRLSPGDRIVLTTDGITDVLDDETIVGVVDWRRYPQAAAEALVAEALEQDSKDNASCVVAELVAVHQDDRATEPAREALEIAAA